jgi:hypothetical protein
LDVYPYLPSIDIPLQFEICEHSWHGWELPRRSIMANGQMGKRISEETKASALKLIAKGNSVPQVAV